MGDKYNDDFQLVLNGSNIARLTNGEEVRINNLGKSRSDQSTWSADYIDNPNRLHFAGMSGYTKVLTAQGNVRANQEAVLNVTVMDNGDGIFDTAVFLEGNSFSLDALPSPGFPSNSAQLVTRAPTRVHIATSQHTASYAYSYGLWSTCSVTCGTGVQSRTPSCVSNTGQIAQSFDCVGQSQPLTQPCTMPACVVQALVGPCSGIFGSRQATAQEMTSAFVSAVGTDVTPVLWGPATAFGTFCGGTFGLVAGIVVSTGKVSDLGIGDTQPGRNDGPTARTATDYGPTGARGDNIGFQLSFIPRTQATLRFRYVMASCERRSTVHG
jgi:hypothetical protein